MRHPAQVESAARAFTEKAINVLAGIMMDETAPPRARVAACIAILDRGWGKPKEIQEYQGEGGERLQKIVHEIVYWKAPDETTDSAWHGNGKNGHA